MSTLEIVVALLRGAHMAALVSLFGTLVFLTLVAPAAVAEAAKEAPHLQRQLLRVARISAVLALIVGIAWIAVESAVIAGAGSVAMTLQALPVVALRTQFGQWLLVRGVLLLTVPPLLRLRRAGNAGAAVLAAMALALQPMLGHAGALGGSLGTTLIISEILHLLAAGAWLGGLLPLFITLGTLPHNAAATACRNFTPVGLSAVLVLGGTATVQVTEFMGGVPGLFGTGYGHIALVKLGLFAVLLALAAINRLALTDRLAGTAPDTARRHMRVSVATEAVLGTLVVLTASLLASHAPGTHEQPVWPFAWRPSLSAFYVPELRNEVTLALLAAGAAVIMAVIGVVWRKGRWPALVVAVITLALAIPHLDLLFVAAYPTSFFTSPTEFAATAIVHGARLFASNCVACHGAQGHGDGPAAKSLPLPPADLTASHFWAHNDGELYWFISHGITAPDGATAMPGFAGTLSSEAIWDLIDYLSAHNAGDTMQRTGNWQQPTPMPQFDAQCANGRVIDLDDLRGHALRIIAVSGDELPEPSSAGDVDAMTILVTRKIATEQAGPACIASEPQAWTALAIIVGSSPDTLAGTQLLVDQNAWLRAKWRPGDPEDWNDPRVLSALLRNIAAHPIIAASDAHAHHH
jgi:putative copper export protein/mono/diheme cytochrome c family protein